MAHTAAAAATDAAAAAAAAAEATPDAASAAAGATPTAELVQPAGAAAVSGAANADASPDPAAVIAKATELLAELFATAGVDDSHGVLHARKVLGNLDAALAAAAPERPVTPARHLACRLAALLHDADDKKYFKHPAGSATPYPNAASVAARAGAPAPVAADMLRMIGWVSCSKNGNSCPPEAVAEPELLWPRWADRLEAVGEVGVARCYIYNVHAGEALSTPDSPRPQTEAEALALATPERFAQYQAGGGGSASMIDHYYDKLLSVARPPPKLVRNKFLEEAALQSAAPLLKVCLAFAEKGEVPIEYIESMATRHGLALPERVS